jgi:hypothetical protein
LPIVRVKLSLRTRRVRAAAALALLSVSGFAHAGPPTFGGSHFLSASAGPFDLSIAPFANGLFIGDYQLLAAAGSGFVPFFAKTNTASPGNRTDVFVSLVPARVEATRQGVAGAAFVAREPLTPALAARVNRTIRRAIDDRGARFGDALPR